MEFANFEWAKRNEFIQMLNNPIPNIVKKMWFKYKLKKRLKLLSPGFNCMVDIAEFLYYLDLLYLFENDADINGISGVLKSNLKQCTIIVKPNKAQTIKITLTAPNYITIETANNGKLRNKISFEDGEAEVDTIYRRKLFLTIIDCLMDSFTKVLLKYI